MDSFYSGHGSEIKRWKHNPVDTSQTIQSQKNIQSDQNKDPFVLHVCTDSTENITKFSLSMPITLKPGTTIALENVNFEYSFDYSTTNLYGVVVKFMFDSFPDNPLTTIDTNTLIRHFCYIDASDQALVNSMYSRKNDLVFSSRALPRANLHDYTNFFFLNSKENLLTIPVVPNRPEVMGQYRIPIAIYDFESDASNFAQLFSITPEMAQYLLAIANDNAQQPQLTKLQALLELELNKMSDITYSPFYYGKYTGVEVDAVNKQLSFTSVNNSVYRAQGSTAASTLLQDNNTLACANALSGVFISKQPGIMNFTDAGTNPFNAANVPSNQIIAYDEPLTATQMFGFTPVFGYCIEAASFEYTPTIGSFSANGSGVAFMLSSGKPDLTQTTVNFENIGMFASLIMRYQPSTANKFGGDTAECVVVTATTTLSQKTFDIFQTSNKKVVWVNQSVDQTDSLNIGGEIYLNSSGMRSPRIWAEVYSDGFRIWASYSTGEEEVFYNVNGDTDGITQTNAASFDVLLLSVKEKPEFKGSFLQAIQQFPTVSFVLGANGGTPSTTDPNEYSTIIANMTQTTATDTRTASVVNEFVTFDTNNNPVFPQGAAATFTNGQCSVPVNLFVNTDRKNQLQNTANPAVNPPLNFWQFDSNLLFHAFEFSTFINSLLGFSPGPLNVMPFIVTTGSHPNEDVSVWTSNGIVKYSVPNPSRDAFLFYMTPQMTTSQQTEIKLANITTEQLALQKKISSMSCLGHFVNADFGETELGDTCKFSVENNSSHVYLTYQSLRELQVNSFEFAILTPDFLPVNINGPLSVTLLFQFPRTEYEVLS